MCCRELPDRRSICNYRRKRTTQPEPPTCTHTPSYYALPCTTFLWFFFFDQGLCNFWGIQHAEWSEQEVKNMLVYMCMCVCLCMHLLVENGHHGDLQSFNWLKWAVGSIVRLSFYTIAQMHVCVSTLQSFVLSIQRHIISQIPLLWDK